MNPFIKATYIYTKHLLPLPELAMTVINQLID